MPVTIPPGFFARRQLQRIPSSLDILRRSRFSDEDEDHNELGLRIPTLDAERELESSRILSADFLDRARRAQPEQGILASTLMRLMTLLGSVDTVKNRMGLTWGDYAGDVAGEWAEPGIASKAKAAAMAIPWGTAGLLHGAGKGLLEGAKDVLGSLSGVIPGIGSAAYAHGRFEKQ